MLQLPEAQLGSNANQHLHDIYSHCQSGTCLFSEHCILNRKIKMNWWRWEMTSSQAKHTEKYRLWGNRDSGRWLQGDAQPGLAEGPGAPPMAQCSWDAPTRQQGHRSLVPLEPQPCPLIPRCHRCILTASPGWSYSGSSAQGDGRCPAVWERCIKRWSSDPQRPHTNWRGPPYALATRALGD